MSTPKSLAAYDDCLEQFERALASERGVAITLASSSEATRFVQRANAYRVLLRDRNKHVYEMGHAMHGLSPYDKFKIARDPDDDCRVLIKPYDQKIAKVEDL